MSRILVTGINGFVGKHLARELISQGIEVVGTGHDTSIHPEISDIVSEYIPCDLTNTEEVITLPLDKVDAIINLAGLANVGASFENEELYKKVNVGVLSTIGELLLENKYDTRIIAVSTGAVYDSNQPLPQTETSKTVITSPYSESKLLMEAEASRLRENGVDCIIARPFNHTGPGQAPGFLVPDLYEKLRADPEHIIVGNLQTKRDYTDVRDIAHAYFLLATSSHLESSVYNICSGQSLSGEQVLGTFIEVLNIDKSRLTIEVKTNPDRKVDPPELFGSHALLTEATGWEPQIPFEQTVRDFVASKES